MFEPFRATVRAVRNDEWVTLSEIIFRESAPMWTRRNLIETAALGATGIVAASRFARAQAASDSGHVHEDAMWKACGDTCDACAKACNTAFHHCVTLAAAGKAQHCADGPDRSRLRSLLRTFGRDVAVRQCVCHAELYGVCRRLQALRTGMRRKRF